MVKVNEEAVLAVKLALIMPCGNVHRRAIVVSADAARFMSMARGVHRLDEAQCNRDLTEREETRRTKLLQAIRELAAEYGIARVEHNSDPRGYPVYLHFPDGRGNSWGGDEKGWGI